MSSKYVGNVVWGEIAVGRRGNRTAGAWQITAEPHVSRLLKRTFPRAREEAHVVLLADSEEVCRNLLWFMARYPLRIEEAEREQYMVAQAKKHEEREERIRKLLAGEPVEGFTTSVASSAGRQMTMALMALPPRDYQTLGAEVAATTQRLLLGDDLGTGKAQPLDAKVLTPTGWRQMGDLHVGDEVVDPDGGVAKVEGVFPQGEKDIYRVTMADGGYTECCEEHLWLLYTNADRQRGGKGRVLALKDFKDKVWWKNNGKPHGRTYSIPIATPAQFTRMEGHPLHPWLLGALLGDGHLKLKAVAFATADEEIRAKVAVEAAFFGVRVVHVAGPNYRLSKNRGEADNRLLAALRSLGLTGKRSWEKRIPDEYMLAPISGRLMLLQGLMDTDGTCGRDGLASFCTTSEVMAHQVRDLVCSLGGTATITTRFTHYTHLGEKRRGRRSYTLQIRTPVCPFSLQRKAVRWKPSRLTRCIDKVEFVGRKQAQCIQVGTKRHLYVTDNYIVTHNTITTLTLLTRPETRPAVVVAPGNLIPQWMAQVAKFVPGLTTREAKTGNPEELTRPYRGKVRPLPDILFITYHKLRGWVEALISAGFRTVIFEEVHELRTGPDSEKWTSAKQLSEAMQYALGLTATPVFNYGGQAYWLFDAIRPGCLGTEMEFSREWCGGASLSNKARVEDGRAFGTYLRREGLMLRRTKRELGISLPKVTRNIQYIDSDLSVIQKAEDAVAELARIVLAQQGFSPMQKLHAGGEMDVRLRKATGIAKAPFVANFVRMLVESGEDRPEPVLLSGHHYEVYDIWRESLKDLNPVFWTGRESRLEKQDSLRRVLNREAHVFVVANRAGAGLDGLQTVCSTLVEGELDWAGGVGQQLQGRLDRDGQLVPVMRHTLISNSGCDPIMADVLGIKMGQLETINNPEADEVAEVQTDPSHIRNLAQAVLARRGLSVAEVA